MKLLDTNKRTRILSIIVLFCGFCIAFGGCLFRLKTLKLENEFEQVKTDIEEKVPSNVSDILRNNDWVHDVEVSIRSSLVENKKYDWFDWNEDCNVVFYMKDDFDALTDKEKCAIINEMEFKASTVFISTIPSTVPAYRKFEAMIIGERNMNVYRRHFGKSLLLNLNSNVTLVTDKNKYEYCSNHTFKINGEYIYVKELDTRFPEPYVGMDEKYILHTELGYYSYYKDYAKGVKIDRRIRTYYWEDPVSGKRIFEALLFGETVHSICDYRTSPATIKDACDDLVHRNKAVD